MKVIRRAWLPLAALALGGLGSVAQAQDEQQERMREALASPERSAENKARDEARRPVDVIQFVGIETGMTVLDVIAAGGWYTEVLSAAVGPSGQVYSQNPAFFLQREGFVEAEQARNERLGNVEAVHGNLADADIQGEIDAAITALNFHDTYNRGGEEAGVAFFEGIYDVLKPGGVLGVADHAGIAGQDNAELHRVEPSAARAALEETGFIVEAESDLLENPDDDHTLSIRDPSLERNTDRFLFRARKPL